MTAAGTFPDVSAGIQAIAIGTVARGGTMDREADEARHMLSRSLSHMSGPIWRLPADSLAGLAAAALDRAAAQGFPDRAMVLLLAHDQLLPAPGCLEFLANTARMDDSSCAAACDSVACGPVDYLTRRGFERFAAGCSVIDKMNPAGLPLALVASLGALKDGRWRRAPRVPNAWVHDFSGYRAHRREEMIGLLPSRCDALLDVGGGCGGFLQSVKQCRPDCRTALAELSTSACASARGRVDRIWEGDFLALNIDEQFDCITFLDVLEHAAEPQSLLEGAGRLLVHDGCVVASLPNIGHWSVVADLLEGRWDYAPAGIHCITHLRFFTRKTIADLFEAAGFTVERWEAARLPAPAWFDVSATGSVLSLDHDSLATVAWHIRARRRR